MEKNNSCTFEVVKYLSLNQFITNYINDVKKIQCFIKCFITEEVQQHLFYVVLCIITTKDDQIFQHRLYVSAASYEDVEKLVDKSIPDNKVKIAVLEPINKRDTRRIYRALIE